MTVGVKKGFCRFQVGRLEPFAEPAIGISLRDIIGPDNMMWDNLMWDNLM